MAVKGQYATFAAINQHYPIMKLSAFKFSGVFRKVLPAVMTVVLAMATASCSSDKDDEPAPEPSAEHSEYEELAYPYFSCYPCEEGITDFYASENSAQLVCTGLKNGRLWFAIFDKESKIKEIEWQSVDPFNKNVFSYNDDDGNYHEKKVKEIRWKWIGRSYSGEHEISRITFIFKIVTTDGVDLFLPVMIDRDNGKSCRLNALTHLDVVNRGSCFVAINNVAWNYDGSVLFRFDESFYPVLDEKAQLFGSVMYTSSGNALKLEALRCEDGLLRYLEYVGQTVYWTHDITADFEEGSTVTYDRISSTNQNKVTYRVIVTAPSETTSQKYYVTIDYATGAFISKKKSVL